MVKWAQTLGLYLFWPAVAVVAWGELKPQGTELEAHAWDKLLHFIAYFGLGGIMCLALKGDRRVISAVLGLIVMGGVLEVVQGFTGRDASLYDELANSLGAVTGAGLGWLALRFLRS